MVFCGSESLTTLENKILESMVPSFHIYFWSPEPGLLRTQSPTSMRPKWLWERENPYHCPRSHAAQLTSDRVAVSSIEGKSKCVLLFIGNLFIFEMAKPVAGEIVELETKVKLKFGCNAGCLMRK